MTWTYLNDFTNSQKDRVRREIGDVSIANQLLSDEEIVYAGTVEGSDLAVAARCCEWIAASLGMKADMTEGHLSIKLSQRRQAYQEKAQLLRARNAELAVPFAGGISITDKDSTDDDTDRVPPSFYRGMTDNPGAEQGAPDMVMTDANAETD